MKPSVIVWDLETVPDLGGFAAANDLVGKSEADIRAVLGNQRRTGDRAAAAHRGRSPRNA
jgi:hypothetical protein